MTDFNPETDLKLERIVDIKPELVWKAWTEPKHLMKWFCPLPWLTTDCRIDLRPGGEFYTMMKGPEGQEHPGSGCYLEIVPNQRLVWTDALKAGYRPTDEGMQFTAFLMLEPQGNGTKYTVVAKHKTPEIKKQHEEMGFEQGWGMALDQLVDYMKLRGRDI